jgi:hypothetical protein
VNRTRRRRIRQQADRAARPADGREGLFRIAQSVPGVSVGVCGEAFESLPRGVDLAENVFEHLHFAILQVGTPVFQVSHSEDAFDSEVGHGQACISSLVICWARIRRSSIGRGVGISTEGGGHILFSRDVFAVAFI